METFGPSPPTKQFVLCFDGTGNKFAGDESDTNLVKIYRVRFSPTPYFPARLLTRSIERCQMLDRSKSHQYHYYQPGIGTYVTSHSLGSKGRLERIKSSYKKAKDAALGSSFDEHVLGGYKFLMRYYSPGDDIYFFGFSRGSYTARFLAEMLDYIGLLQPGNEELIRFAWKTFAKWQQRRDSTEQDNDEKKKLFRFMKAFRETFSRPVARIRFLGLFDTVNSVPMFENAWMERNKFPYTAQSTARVIRHAVSIDERRAKFRQDLISEAAPHRAPAHHAHRLRHLLSREDHAEKRDIPEIVLDTPEDEMDATRQSHHSRSQPEEQRYRAPSPSPIRGGTAKLGHEGLSPEKISLKSAVSRTSLQVPSLNIPKDEEDAQEQDISEVWFPGQHGDVGGGWKLNPDDRRPLSHIPLVWMVNEAQLVGLEFDAEKLKRFNCYDGITGLAAHNNPNQCREDPYHQVLTETMDRGIVHDCLTYGGGVSAFSTLAWRLMEYLPFRRMDLQPDGSWKPIRWPLPFGEVRDIPHDAQIHACAIRRMQIDPDYRPGNLIIGGGGRGMKRAPEKYGIGEWEICKHEGDPVRQTYVRKKTARLCDDPSHSAGS